MATDIKTLATRQDIQVHVDDLVDSLTKALEATARLQVHARGPEKAKWGRVQVKVQRAVGAVDRVLSSV